MELELLGLDYHGMPGITTALVADDQVGICGEDIGDLALALITPLRADNNGDRHSCCCLLTHKKWPRGRPDGPWIGR